MTLKSRLALLGVEVVGEKYARDPLVSRLRGVYCMGPESNPQEFGTRTFQVPPINVEAAERIESLELACAQLAGEVERLRAECRWCEGTGKRHVSWSGCATPPPSYFTCDYCRGTGRRP